MRPSRPSPSRPAALAVIVSLGLHLALLGALALLPTIERLRPEPDEGIEVELVTPEQIAPKPEGLLPDPLPPEALPPEALPPEVLPPAVQPAPQTRSVAQPEAAPAEQPPPVQPPSPAPPPVPTAPVMGRARRLLSEDVLSNPRSRGTRAALQQLQEPERIEQLCNLEAMGQIHAWKAEFQPDRVVAYAMEGVRLSRTALQADGAVFRSKQQWYRMKFKCELAPDHRTVSGFEFMVGEPVPRHDWRGLDLPAEH